MYLLTQSHFPLGGLVISRVDRYLKMLSDSDTKYDHRKKLPPERLFMQLPRLRNNFYINYNCLY